MCTFLSNQNPQYSNFIDLKLIGRFCDFDDATKYYILGNRWLAR